MNYKSILAAFAICAAPGGALAQSLDTLNPNAVGEAFSRIILESSGKKAKDRPYISADENTMFCVGKIPSKPVDIAGANGKSILMEPAELEIVKYSKHPGVDAETKKKLQDIIKRDDVVYLEFTSVDGPGSKDIETYFEKTTGKKPLLAATPDAGTRDGGKITLFAIEKDAFAKVVASNKPAFDAQSAQYAKDFEKYKRYWSDCGPKK